MSAQLTFPLNPWTHDPSGQAIDYTCPLPAVATDTVTTVTVTAVDDNDAPLVGDPLVISNVSFALVGSVWMATFWLASGTPGTIYKLRCRWTLSDGRGSDRTVRLRCAQT